jgi:hypothetical protein
VIFISEDNYKVQIHVEHVYDFYFIFVSLYPKTCYICDEQGRESKAATGACMTCNKHGCRQAFHVTW